MSFKSHFPKSAVTYNSMTNPNAFRNGKFITIPALFISFMFIRHMKLGSLYKLDRNIYVDKNSALVPKPISFD